MKRILHSFSEDLNRSGRTWFATILILLGIPLRFDHQTQAGATIPADQDTLAAGRLFDRAAMSVKAGRIDSAILLYTQAAEIYQSRQCTVPYIRCLNRLCEQYLTAGAVVPARTFAAKALILSRMIKDDRETGNSLSGMGTILYTTGRLDSAMIFFNEALAAWQKTGNADPLSIADVYANMAGVHYWKDEFEPGLGLIKKSIRMVSGLKGDYRDKLAGFYNVYGAFCYARGDYANAASWFRKAMEIWLGLYPENHPLLYQIYNNLGEIYLNNGEFSKALLYFNKSLSIAVAAGGPDDLRVAQLRYNIGNTCLEMRNFSAARDALQSALRIWTMMAADPNSAGYAYNSLGRLYEYLDIPDSTEYYYQKAVALFDTTGAGHPSLAVIYGNLGTLYTKTRNDRKALLYYEKALTMMRSFHGEKHPKMATFYSNLAKLWSQRKNYPQALRYFQKSMIANVPEFNDTNIFHNPSPANVSYKLALLGALKSKANIFFDMYDDHHDSLFLLRTALATLDLAVSLTDTMRRQNRPEDIRVLLNPDYLPFRDGIIYAYLLYKRTGDPAYMEHAFCYAEKERYANLLASLRELEARDLGGIPDSLQQMERSLQADIAYYTRLIRDAVSPGRADSAKVKGFQQALFRLNFSNDSLIRTFEMRYPQYYQLKYDLHVSSTREIRDVLKEDEVMLEYTQVWNKLLTFIISRYSVSLVSTVTDSSYDRDIDDLRRMILSPDPSRESAGRYRMVAGRLYEILLKKAEPLIKGKKLLVIPFGRMGVVPFQALVPPAETTTIESYHDIPYLLHRHPVGYCYSATIYLNSMKMRNRASRKGILAFAPSFSSGNPGDQTGHRGDVRPSVAMPASREEVISIRDQRGGTLFLDTAATKANFLKHAPAYKILHISTHGFADDLKPLESRLQFYRANDSSDADLFTYELYNMKLHAGLAVLSACNTGYGKLEDGEGIMSIARGFMFAGVPAVVSTLWSVNDRSTAFIMKDFYRNLDNQEDKPEALRHAQIDYLAGSDEITSHPFYWAGYISIGNNSPLANKNLYIYLGILVVAGVLILSGLTSTIGKRLTRR